MASVGDPGRWPNIGEQGPVTEAALATVSERLLRRVTVVCSACGHAHPVNRYGDPLTARSNECDGCGAKGTVPHREVPDA